MKDFTIMLEDKPGSLAEVATTLGNAGINIEGGCGFTAMGKGIFHLLVKEGGKAREVLEQAGIAIAEEKDVLVVSIENKPSALATVSQKLANAGINLDLFYIISFNRVALGVNDVEKARSVL
ncbi:MAG: amino acid-binding protein [Candidatus Heimdallarchaeota archaeon]|nr:amino acid-binding protein [Candidatus Heimdallarchaeota archaeon]